MRSTPQSQLEAARQVHPLFGPSKIGSMQGYFELKRQGSLLYVISSGPDEWEHVSVSIHPKPSPRCPTWDEMCFIKDLFWLPKETVVQFHPARSEYVNHHKHCLHLWRNTKQEILLPPKTLV